MYKKTRALVVVLLLSTAAAPQVHAQWGSGGGGWGLPPSLPPVGGGLPGGGFPGGGLPGLPGGGGFGGGLPGWLPGGGGGGLFDKASMVWHLAQQLIVVKKQLETMKNNLLSYKNIADWSGRDWLRNINRAIGQATRLSYMASDINAEMERAFGTEGYDGTYIEEKNEQLREVLGSMRGVVSSARAHHQQIMRARAQMNRLRSDNLAAQGNLQAAQAQSNILLFQAENLQLLREQINALMSMQAIENQRRISNKARARQTARNINAQILNRDRSGDPLTRPTDHSRPSN